MTLLILSFVAGVLTVTAPCILAFLPVIVGGTIARGGTTKKEREKSWYRPLVIAASLALSVILFTLLLKATTSLLGVPQWVWQVLSGVIVILLGINFLKPSLWESLPLAARLNIRSNQALYKSTAKKGFGGDILIGFSLGPVFSSCSPTYAFVVASILPVSFAEGFLYLLAYAAGLAVALLLVGYAGQALVAKLGWLSNPKGWLHRVVGILFILVGLLVLLGGDKMIQSYALGQGWYDGITKFEQSIEH